MVYYPMEKHIRKIKLTSSYKDIGKRLDLFICERIQKLSRSRVQKLISQGNVFVNNQKKSKSHFVKRGDDIEVNIPPLLKLEAKPEDIKINIIYEDEDIIVLSKPAGIVVHPSPGHPAKTIVNALLFHTKFLSGIGGVLRPGIVHRLDKQTSGLMIVAKNDDAHKNLSQQFKKKSVKKIYLALVHGRIEEDEGKIDAPIGRSRRNRKKMSVIPEGRESVTEFEVLKRFNNFTLIKVRPITGRTHQIRVHLSYIGKPVVGDVQYRKRRRIEDYLKLKRHFLHASKLEFKHPRDGKEMSFEDKLPEELKNSLNMLENKNIDF